MWTPASSAARPTWSRATVRCSSASRSKMSDRWGWLPGDPGNRCPSSLVWWNSSAWQNARHRWRIWSPSPGAGARPVPGAPPARRSAPRPPSARGATGPAARCAPPAACRRGYGPARAPPTPRVPPAPAHHRQDPPGAGLMVGVTGRDPYDVREQFVAPRPLGGHGQRSKRAAPNSTRTTGWASRLWYQPGAGDRRGRTRRRGGSPVADVSERRGPRGPERAPVVVSNSRSPPAKDADLPLVGAELVDDGLVEGEGLGRRGHTVLCLHDGRPRRAACRKGREEEERGRRRAEALRRVRARRIDSSRIPRARVLARSPAGPLLFDRRHAAPPSLHAAARRLSTRSGAPPSGSAPSSHLTSPHVTSRGGPPPPRPRTPLARPRHRVTGLHGRRAPAGAEVGQGLRSLVTDGSGT